MRFYPVDKVTYETVKMEPLAPGTAAPSGVKFQYQPRIRCFDCPGKMYTALPGQVVENFEVHLRNRGHRDQVDKRKGRAR